MIDSPLPLLAVIGLVAAAAFWLDYKVAPLSKIGASLLAILLGALLSNFGVVPAASPIYGVITGPVTFMAIAWLLLSLDLRDIKKAGGRMVGAFGIAVVGTAIGTFIGAFIFAGYLGAETSKLAGTLTGTYSGGSLNFVAVASGLGLSETLIAGATAADNLTTGLWLGATLLVPIWLRRFYPTPIPSRSASEEEVSHPFFGKESISTLDLALLVAIALTLVVVAEWVGSVVPGIPAVLWLTTLALIVGHMGAARRLKGGMQLGNLALHLFFVVIGIFSQVGEILAVGVQIFFYTLVVVGIHGLFVYGVGRLFKMDLGTLSVASQAAIGGPTSAMAVAVSREWKALILPGIIVGLLGYAVGNYLGFAVAGLVEVLGVG